ncbi:uncharacterized protein J8A68_005758 [[Candida] subhashii]|uniref:PQ-loop repeat-containing protein 1 n=1 Tax=[Candida] subhashii TaxID=561895 RepID=A0A8J5UJ45_9ASCO|nr:uncharacterized protein J8A68_005758 [[Candida] subhashii]KAG7660796.1 hypothetical protein J8A68_005758 [[Candida] subhashii]
MSQFIPEDYLPYLDYLPDLQKCANLFMTFTPVFSYGSTCYSIYRRRTSQGFSIDICGTMFMASILRIYYYICSPFEVTLLRQSIMMILIQIVLLKISLKYRYSNYDPEFLTPMPHFSHELQSRIPRRMSSANAMQHEGYWTGDWRGSISGVVADYGKMIVSYVVAGFISILRLFDVYYLRPGQFWQWKLEEMYWRFLIVFAGGFGILTGLFYRVEMYGSIIGTLGLFIESLLPLPQILLLNRLQSVENFKIILLLSWLGGDCIKISYLLFGTNNISAIFIIAGLFQMSLDIYIAVQYLQLRFNPIENTKQLPQHPLDKSVDEIVNDLLELQELSPSISTASSSE